MTQPQSTTDDRRTGPLIQAYGEDGVLRDYIGTGVIILNPDGSIPASAPIGDATAANQVLQITQETAAASVLGTTAGAAVITDANGTLQQYARGLIVQFAAFLTRLPAALGAGGGLKIDGSGTALPVSGPMTSTEFLADLRSTMGAPASVNSGTSSVPLLAANGSRKGATITNTDANVLYVLLSGGTASATNFHVSLASGGYYEVPFGITSAITGIWAADGSGVALVGEAV